MGFARRNIIIGFCNLNGFNSSILGNKLKTNDFLSIINKHDINDLVETETNINKFNHVIKCRNQSGTDLPGGFLYIQIKNSLNESPIPRLKTKTYSMV